MSFAIGATYAFNVDGIFYTRSDGRVFTEMRSRYGDLVTALQHVGGSSFEFEVLRIPGSRVKIDTRWFDRCTLVAGSTAKYEPPRRSPPLVLEIT